MSLLVVSLFRVCEDRQERLPGHSFCSALGETCTKSDGGPRRTVPSTTHSSDLVFPRCASAGDDGLVLVWNIQVNNYLQRRGQPARDTLALIVHFPPSDRGEAAGAAGPFPADNSHDHLHLSDGAGVAHLTHLRLLRQESQRILASVLAVLSHFNFLLLLLV